MSNIIIFEQGSQPVEVRLEGETVWLSQAQMAELFDTSTDNISLNLKKTSIAIMSWRRRQLPRISW